MYYIYIYTYNIKSLSDPSAGGGSALLPMSLCKQGARVLELKDQVAPPAVPAYLFVYIYPCVSVLAASFSLLPTICCVVLRSREGTARNRDGRYMM